MVDYLTGVLQIGNTFLAIVAGFIAATLYKHSSKKEFLAWKPLIFGLILLFVEEIIASFRSFGIYDSPYLTHIIPSFILGLLIYALAVQVDVARHY